MQTKKSLIIICIVLLVVITVITSLFTTGTISLQVGQLENKISAHEAVLVNDITNVKESDFPFYVSIMYSTTSQSYTHQTIPIKISKNGEFAIKLIGLTPDTTYYYYVRVIRSDFIVFGNEEKSFTTAKE
jgi:hypothetical protein